MTIPTARRPLARSLLAASILALVLPRPAALADPPDALADTDTLHYAIDVTDRSGDRFEARLRVDGLTAENAVLQFPATAPGTYQVMDIGRFVEDLHAFDGEGNPIGIERVSPNRWRIDDPASVREITWRTAETWDTPVEEHPVYPMAGTSIEADHVLFNAHAVLGFPTGLQDTPITLDVRLPDGWTVGTALESREDGAYVAEDYDFLVDSPILAGELTVATTEVSGVPIEIYAYSESGGIRAEMLLESMTGMLEASGEFLDGLPVDRYVFLWHFEGSPVQGAAYGAWEHSYSSEYVFPDVAWSERFAQAMTDVAAHEFLHIVTPLNIHSGIIENFDFETPVPSRHLWLYEGVTEWAAHASQMRAGLESPEAYLEQMARKIAVDRQYFDPDYSLERLALTSYTDEGQAQYGNIYQRGAVVAGLLDIRLLELSEGERGLQALVLELMDRYGKKRPFDDEGFYDVIVEMTHPEIGEFFERYVRNAEPLPVAAYYSKLGIEFVDDGPRPRFEILAEPAPSQARLRAAWLRGANTGAR